ncbi:MAG: EF-P beta-lysylation protein EpmB, partial [Planctomycetaceae bacterium]|nr:EF-P beta-lysylation protein EpmB [Planctomycetaceae bacterium]
HPALEEISADSTVREVILSGGDPLMLTDERLRWLCDRIADIGHVERIRLHTRLPIVLPDRITSELLEILTGLRPQTVVVVHANHGNEIVDDCAAGLKRLSMAGFPVLNQAVLLKDINDSVDALELLCRRLINVGVIPYYLHQLDTVSGAAHFQVDVETGRRLIAELESCLPGYAVPRYVREIPGHPGKTRL